MEYQFIEFTKNIINNYKNRSYLILNETIESNFTSLWTVINTNIIDFIKGGCGQILGPCYFKLVPDFACTP